MITSKLEPFLEQTVHPIIELTLNHKSFQLKVGPRGLEF